ncbi:hypothetical protein M2413_000246 [Pseudomonas putida]|nr:hypothetical protein [Pseudomonas putida]
MTRTVEHRGCQRPHAQGPGVAQSGGGQLRGQFEV